MSVLFKLFKQFQFPTFTFAESDHDLKKGDLIQSQQAADQDSPYYDRIIAEAQTNTSVELFKTNE